jgi:Rrf2 family protein
MRISTRGRYALKMMIEFAKHPDTTTKICQVSRSQHISEKYLEQIVSVLTKAGFVKSLRGAQGGYLLTRKPSEYSVGEILRLTEGSLAPVACLDDDSAPCDLADCCVSRSVFQKIEDAVNQVVDHISLADLLARDSETTAAEGTALCQQRGCREAEEEKESEKKK